MSAPEPPITLWYHKPLVWVCVGIALCLGTLAMPPALRVYRQWNAGRKVQRANEAVARGEYQVAVINARGALAVNSKNVQALLVMARTAEAMKAPEAVKFRREIEAIEPGQVENLLALTKDLLEAGNASAAEQAFGAIGQKAEANAVYHDLAAQLAVQRGDRAAAEAHWAKAAELAPADVHYRINLARQRLGLPNVTARSRGLQVLEAECQNPAIRVEVLRSLLEDALAHNDTAKMLEWANALATAPEAGFPEKLTRLSVLRILLRRPSDGLAGSAPITESQFSGELRKAQEEAAKGATTTFYMISWMNDNDQALLVPEWAERLAPALVGAPPACMALAEAYARSSAWKKLQGMTEKSSWPAMEYLREAYLARALDGLGDQGAATSAWNRALHAAEERPATLEVLCKETRKWGWELRTEQALWRLAAKGDCPRWAADSLWKTALARHDTPALWKASRLLLQADPMTVATRNNFIQLSLLTGQETASAHRLAAALYQEHPMDESVVSTYGYSLFLQGKAGEAVQAVDHLPPAASSPSTDFYHAVFLAAAGRGEQAEAYFKRGATAPKLSEELALNEVLRLAFAARDRQATGNADGTGRVWTDAVVATHKEPAQLEMLFSLAREWKWEDRAGEVLLKLMDLDRCPTAATETLWKAAVRSGDSTTINQAGKLILAKNPQDPLVRSSFIAASLWSKAEGDAPFRQADALYQEFPGQPEVAATHALSLWRKGRPEDAVAALRALPAEQRGQGRPALYLGMALAAAGQPNEAEEWVRLGAPFAQFPEEKAILQALERAYRWHHLAEQGEKAAATAAWKEAVTAAIRQPEVLETLGRLALAWGATDQAAEALWLLSENNDCPRWVSDFLWQNAEQQRDGERLYLASRLLRKAEPKSITARNNVIWLSLLTGHETELPHRQAETLLQENPGQPEVAATRALSLFQLGKAKEAVGVLAKLNAAQLRTPRVALYYGLALAADGQAAEAREYLTLGQQKPLLAQEEKLLAKLPN